MSRGREGELEKGKKKDGEEELAHREGNKKSALPHVR